MHASLLVRTLLWVNIGRTLIKDALLDSVKQMQWMVNEMVKIIYIRKGRPMTTGFLIQ